MSKDYIPHVHFTPHHSDTDLSSYQWNDHTVNALFCKNCGIFPYFGNEEWGYRVNLGCVETLDALALKINIIDGASIPLSNKPGPHPGE